MVWFVCGRSLGEFRRSGPPVDRRSAPHDGVCLVRGNCSCTITVCQAVYWADTVRMDDDIGS